MALKNFLEELRWRGLLQDSMPGTEEMLLQGPTRGYIGFDPTADSLHVGNMVQIAMLMHFQRAGHLPIALVGGATGMVGDPSGKKSERQLLVEEELRHNESCIKKQLERFIDFGKGSNPGSSAGAGSAELVNNYDWFKDMSFLDFIRNVGKHISVNYMMAKDSVKSRLETGLSFTEFSYQLVQGYDFYWLWKHKGCKLQMGGSDQWGNITTGTELIRRMEGGEAFALTTPLLTKSDGSKFGKSDPGSGTGMTGNVWLDAKRTSPYKFYQFWLNASDEDVVRHAHVFTSWSKEEVDALVMDHSSAPHQRRLQKEVAGFITAMTHGKNELDAAINASEILFGSGATEALGTLSEQQWLDVFDGVPQCEMSKSKIEAGTSIVDLLSDHTGFLTSKGEAKRALKEASISINKAKAAEDRIVNASDLISGKFILLQRGKKNYFLVKAV